MLRSTRTSWIAAQLRAGATIAYPTEGVYGLGCLPGNSYAIQRLLTIKQRPINKGLLLVGSKLTQFSPWIKSLADAQQHTIEQHYQAVQHRQAHPTTWIVPARPSTSPLLRGDFPTLGIRLCPHPVVTALCEQLQSPLVSTSANLSGRAPARNRQTLRREFHNIVDIIIGDPTLGFARASQIQSLDQLTIYRP